MALSLLGLENYVLNYPRTNLISTNKEGIVSLTGQSLRISTAHIPTKNLFAGYMAIHLLGLSAGTILLPPSPSYFRRHQRAPLPKENDNADTDTDNDSDSNDVNHKSFPKIKGNGRLRRQNDKTAIELCSYAVVWWVLMGLTRILSISEGISRRMVSALFRASP
jgi:phosphatidylinositol glycan class W